ncbi:MAG: hypothetical protein WAM91_16955 [Candidatus Acidiferrales bacterium]
MFGFPASLGTIFAALKRHATLLLFAVALAAAALLVHSYLDARKSAAQLAATLAAQQKIISDADARQSARDAALSQSLAQIDALKRAVQTPQQAGAALAQSLPQFIAGSLPTNSPVTQSGAAPNLPSLPAPLQFIPYPNASAASPNNSANAAPATQQGTVAPGQISASPATTPAIPPQQNVVIPSGARSLRPDNPVGTKDPSAAGTSGANGSASSSASPPAQNLGMLSSLKSEISNLKLIHPITPPSAPQQGSAASSRADTLVGVPSVNAAQQGTAASGNSAPSAPSSPQAGSAVTPLPGSICIPPDDLKPLYDSIENCEACAAKLTAAQADLSDETTKFTAASTERDAALRAARGTFWTRTARAAKWIAIGAAAGAVLAKYH